MVDNINIGSSSLLQIDLIHDKEIGLEFLNLTSYDTQPDNPQKSKTTIISNLWKTQKIGEDLYFILISDNQGTALSSNSLSLNTINPKVVFLMRKKILMILVALCQGLLMVVIMQWW